MEFEVTSRYVPSRLSLWCPVCGAKEGQGCTVVKGNRFDSHNAYAMGTVRPSHPAPENPQHIIPRAQGHKPRWSAQNKARWVN